MRKGLRVNAAARHIVHANALQIGEDPTENPDLGDELSAEDNKRASDDLVSLIQVSFIIVIVYLTLLNASLCPGPASLWLRYTYN